MSKQHRFVQAIHTQAESQGQPFRGGRVTLERIAFWAGIVTGAVCVGVFVLSVVRG